MIYALLSKPFAVPPVSEPNDRVATVKAEAIEGDPMEKADSRRGRERQRSQLPWSFRSSSTECRSPGWKRFQRTSARLRKRTFVLFSRGTCVVVEEPCTDPLAEARKKLAACAESEAPFVPEPTSEGDLIITFKEPVFHRFTQNDLEGLLPWLDQVAPALLSPAESMAAVEGWSPHQNAKVGLLARRRMLEDASQAVPVKIIRARNRATAAR